MDSLDNNLKHIADYEDFKIHLLSDSPVENPLYCLGNRHITIIRAELMNCSDLIEATYSCTTF